VVSKVKLLSKLKIKDALLHPPRSTRKEKENTTCVMCWKIKSDKLQVRLVMFPV
jgi:hypothetical protein